MLQIAVPSILQQSTVSIGMLIVQAVVNPFGTQALAGYSATMRVENVFSLIFVSIGNAVSPFVSQNLGAGKPQRIKKGYHAALVLDLCFAAIAFVVIEALHTQISSLFLGKDGTALAYQVSGDYMRWLGYFFIFMGIKMATDGVLRGLGIMRPFLVANMVNLAIRLSVALICAPRFSPCGRGWLRSNRERGGPHPLQLRLGRFAAKSSYPLPQGERIDRVTAPASPHP